MSGEAVLDNNAEMGPLIKRRILEEARNIQAGNLGERGSIMFGYANVRALL